MGLIYMATNTVNGKKYIGQTTMDLNMRISHHRWDKRKYIFGRAIHKYGFDKFEWKVLKDSVLLQEELDRLEIEMIAKYKTVNPHGYNLTHGGNGGRPCEETRQKLVARNKARGKAVICIETGIEYESAREARRQMGFNHDNITLACSNPSMKIGGYHWRYADDTRHAEIMARHEEQQKKKREERARRSAEAKARERAKARKWNTEWHDEVARRKEEQKEKSAALAIEMEKVGGRTEWFRMKGAEAMNNPAHKAKWLANSPDPLATLCERCQPRQVMCVETGRIYRSVSSAEKINGYTSRGIRHAVKNKHRTCGGYHWALVETKKCAESA